MEKIAYAYGYTFYRCYNNHEFYEYMQNGFNNDIPQICEVLVDKIQYFQPKAGSKKLPDGKMVSAPLEDLVPYLDREELENIMKVSKK